MWQVIRSARLLAHSGVINVMPAENPDVAIVKLLDNPQIASNRRQLNAARLQWVITAYQPKNVAQACLMQDNFQLKGRKLTPHTICYDD